MTATQPEAQAATTTWYRLDGNEAARRLAVDPAVGLDPAEAARRLEEHGPNRLEEAARRPRWLAFLDQFRDFLILILLGAAVISLVVSQELKTPVVIAVVVLVNAVLGFVQESRAERSLDALRSMLVSRSRVRRGGRIEEVDSNDLVPGDVVLVEAGDRIPADGRLLLAANLEVEEAALTGESQPSVKGTEVIEGEVGVGDRRNLAFMNTVVTRGRGELLVTTTGMGTEIGRIADLLRSTELARTPLQKQLDALGHTLAKLAGVIVALVFLIGLVRGQDISDLFLTAVALAVASIPEGLPAVVAVTLAIGTYRMAQQNAIVKRLASVETLGSTSVICSDKTGTLTLNQMTAREVVFQGSSHRITGEGYEVVGEVEHLPTDDPVVRALALEAMALCNDATVRDGALVGDPTEGALVVAAAKGGIDVDGLRAAHPRVAEVPFDSATKLMATFHALPDDEGRPGVSCFVKGAPDVLLARSSRAMGPDGQVVPIAERHEAVIAHNERIAEQGLRVLAVAGRRFGEAEFAELQEAGTDLAELLHDLTLVALVGIVDPPRPEARDAIAECKQAGIRVRMITGDHAVTAAAIGRELGIEGDAVSGADLDAMGEAELAERIDDIGVFARVAPEHKLTIVSVLQGRGNVVAMTGDGVNDAPALKRADIGVAMGITGTEVTKEAATMVLTDDNFATIVRAVRAGRTIYDNIVKFVRFQLSTTIGFAVTFLGASLLNIAAGKPFTAIQILWVNLIMDGPPAMALGVDPGGDDIMERRPRPLAERILFPSRLAKLVWYASIMAVGTLLVLQLAPGEPSRAGLATVSGTMAFATFVFFQFFNILNARDEHRTVFRRDTFRNGKLWAALGAVLVLQVVITQVGFLNDLFDTEPLSASQWAVCAAVASSVLWLEELRKVLARALGRGERP